MLEADEAHGQAAPPEVTVQTGVQGCPGAEPSPRGIRATFLGASSLGSGPCPPQEPPQSPGDCSRRVLKAELNGLWQLEAAIAIIKRMLHCHISISFFFSPCIAIRNT